MCKGMRIISKVFLFFLLVFFCLFFVPFTVQASGTGTAIPANGYFTNWSISYPSSSTSVSGTLSTSGTSTGTVSNKNSIANYSGYFYTGSSLSDFVNSISGLKSSSFSTLYSDSLINGATSASLRSGTLYRITGTNSSGQSVDVVCSSVSLSAHVYEFGTISFGSAASSSSSATNKDRGTFSGTFSSSDYAVSSVSYVLKNSNFASYMEVGKEYTFDFYAYYPTGMSCSSFISADVTGSIGFDFDGSAVFSPYGWVHISGTLIPVLLSNDWTFTFSFYMPDNYTLSGLKNDLGRAILTILPANSSVVVDSLTNFEGADGMNASKDHLDGVIGEYDDIEGSLFESGQAAFDKFDPSSLLTFSTGIYAAIASISQLLISIIAAMGEFSVLYTVGMVLVFFGILIGLWRFFK